MSFARTLPDDDIVMVVGFLLPLILPRFNGDLSRGQRLALRLLADYRPRDTRELHMAGEAISHNLRCLTANAQASAPDIQNEARDKALRTACQASRQGLQVQRRLDALQRGPVQPAAAEPDPEPATATVVTSPVPADQPAPPPADDASAPAAQDAGTELTAAENTVRKAQKLLDLMKGHYKGAPPPHSKAAQDIQAQQRAVDMARMQLAHLRAQHARDAVLPLH